MKHLLLSAASIALLSLAGAVPGKAGCVEGSGHVVTETRQTGSFEGVSSEGSMDVVITQGSTTEVRVEADDNILPLITTEVVGHVLKIKVKGKECFNSKHRVIVHATSPTFTALTSSGSGDFTATTKITSGSLALASVGSGSMKLDLEAPNLVTTLGGSGEIVVNGHAAQHTVTVSGSGSVSADGMKNESAVVVLNGSGNCRMDVSRNLMVTLNGSGNVLYHGAPQVQTVINGSGRVRKM